MPSVSLNVAFGGHSFFCPHFARDARAQLTGSTDVGQYPDWAAETILRNARAKGYDGLSLTDQVGVLLWGTDEDRAAVRAVGRRRGA